MNRLAVWRGLVAAAVVLLGVCSQHSASADAIRYELQKGGTVPGEFGGKFGIPLFGGTVNLDLFMLAQGDDGNTSNEGLKIGTGFISSSNGGLRGDLGNFTLDPQFSFNPGTVSKPGTPVDRHGDGDLDLGSGVSGSLSTTTGFNASIDIPSNPGGLRDGIVSAAALGTTGNDWAYAKILSLTFTIDGLHIFSGTATQINFDPRVFIAAHQAIIDGSPLSISGALGITPIQIGPPVFFGPIPEPSTQSLGGLALCGLIVIGLRRRARG